MLIDFKVNNKIQIDSSRDAFNILKKIRHFDQEVLFGLFLNSKNELIAKKEVFRGTLCSILAQPREIYRIALIVNAAKIIVAHNHPSKSFLPSDDDIDFTFQMKIASQIIGISFLDHIIVATNKSYYSFADEGFLNEEIKWPKRFFELFSNKFGYELLNGQGLNLKNS